MYIFWQPLISCPSDKVQLVMKMLGIYLEKRPWFTTHERYRM